MALFNTKTSGGKIQQDLSFAIPDENQVFISGGSGDRDPVIGIRQGDKIVFIQLSNLGRDAGGDPNLGIDQLVALGLKEFESQTGIKISSLQEFNPGDIRSAFGEENFIGGNNNQGTNLSAISQFQNTQSVSQGQDINVSGSSKLGTPAPNTPSQAGGSTPNLSQFGTFDRQLQFGDKGEDVKRLQQFLNASGYLVSKEGDGSPGSETEFFGPLTQKALQAYQKDAGIVDSGDPNSTGFGRFGPQTLKSVNGFTSGSSVPGRTGGDGLEDRVAGIVSGLPPQLQSLYNTMAEYVQRLVDQGKQVNPNIEITPERIQEFVDQAEREFAPFFTGEERATLTDLKRGLDRSVELLRESEEDISRQFEDRFRGIGEEAADRGISSSGERLRLEGDVSDEANRLIRRNRQNLFFGAGTSALSAERSLGSEALGRFEFPTIGRAPLATASGKFQQGQGAQAVGGRQGGIFGALPSQRLTAESLRASELEQSFRARQLLASTQ